MKTRSLLPLVISCFLVAGCGGQQAQNPQDQDATNPGTLQQKPQATFQMPPSVRIRALAFSADSRLLASGGGKWKGSHWVGDVRLWDLITGKERVHLPEQSDFVYAVGFSPDGKYLASGGGIEGSSEIMLLDVATGQVRAILQGHTGVVLSVCFSPDGKTLATGSEDQTIKLWEVPSGKERATLDGHGGGVHSLCFSADSKRLVSGNFDYTVKLWEAAKGELRATLTGQKATVTSVALTADGKTLVSGSWSTAQVGDIKLWDLATAKERGPLNGQTQGILSVVVLENGRTLASLAGGRGFKGQCVPFEMKLWDLGTREEKAHITSIPRCIQAAALTNEGKILATGSDSETVDLWEVAKLIPSQPGG